MKRAWPVLLASLLGYIAIEAAVFHSGLYARYASPDSTTGQLEAKLHNEQIRPKDGTHQVLAIGDSRMALVPRVANQLTAETGLTFGTIALAGTTPRDWYYMLREADPTAEGYRAIVITLPTFDDEETIEPYNLRVSDLNYMVNRLRLGDLWEFSNSFSVPVFKMRMARGILIKGLVYQRDFQQFLTDPKGRIEIADLTWRDSHIWHHDYVETDRNMAGLTVDWETKTLHYPPQADPGLEPELNRNLLQPLPPQTGVFAEYLRSWLTKTVDRYQGSKTTLVFVRLPRGPWIRPDLPPVNPQSSVRVLGRRSNVILMRDDRFSVLERPEYFRDPLHMNQPGLDEFSKGLATELAELLK